MKDVVFVVNPAAAGGRAGALWSSLATARPELAEAQVVMADDADSTVAAVEDALAGSVTRLVVVGGDGTAHLVANTVLARGRGTAVAVGLVPAGTGSDLARTFDLPRDPEAALVRAVSGLPRLIDALQLDTVDGRRRYVVNIASLGISGMVDAAVNASPRRGAGAYLWATLTALWSYRPRVCRVLVDGAVWFEGPLFLLAIANGRSFGRGMRVAPRAEPDDGLADVVLVEAMPRWRLPLRLPRLYLGSHLGLAPVHWCRARTVVVEPREALPPFDVDGEEMPSAGVEVSVLPGALRFVG